MKASRLKAEREQWGWSQNELAGLLEVGVTTLRRWEQGLAVPAPSYREKLVTLFGKTAEELGLPSDADEQGEAPPTAAGSEAAAEASLLTDPAMPEAVGSAKSALTQDGLLTPGKHRFSPRSLWDGAHGSIRDVLTFRPAHRFSWSRLLILCMVLVIALVIVTVIPLLLRRPFPSNIHTQETSRPPWYALTIQNTDPSLDDRALQHAFYGVYPQLVNQFALDPATASRQVTLTLAPDLSSPASISGTTVTISNAWIRQHPTEIGLLTHQLTLLLEHYPAGVPAWFADGLADYARRVYGPADDEWSLPDGVQPHQSYTQGGPIAARFLLWLQLHTRLDILDQLHHALQRGQSFSTVLHRLTHQTVDHLWSLYQAHPDVTPTPEQHYKTVTSRKPIFQSSHEQLNKSPFYYQVPGLYLSNFAMQADITIVSGNAGAGFYFRNNGNGTSNRIYLYSNGCYSLDNGHLTFNPAIKEGLNQTNRLTIIVENSSTDVYINGQFIVSNISGYLNDQFIGKVDESLLLRSYGTLGVMRTTYQSRPDVRFDHIQVF